MVRRPSPRFDDVEGFSKRRLGLLARHRLPARDNGVDVERIDFGAAATPARAFGGEQGSAATEKRIEHDLVSSGRIEDRVRDHWDRLYSWVEHRCCRLPLASKAASTRIVPDIGPVAA